MPDELKKAKETLGRVVFTRLHRLFTTTTAGQILTSSVESIFAASELDTYAESLWVSVRASLVDVEGMPKMQMEDGVIHGSSALVLDGRGVDILVETCNVVREALTRWSAVKLQEKKDDVADMLTRMAVAMQFTDSTFTVLALSRWGYTVAAIETWCAGDEELPAMDIKEMCDASLAKTRPSEDKSQQKVQILKDFVESVRPRVDKYAKCKSALDALQLAVEKFVAHKTNRDEYTERNEAAAKVVTKPRPANILKEFEGDSVNSYMALALTVCRKVADCKSWPEEEAEEEEAHIHFTDLIVETWPDDHNTDYMAKMKAQAREDKVSVYLGCKLLAEQVPVFGEMWKKGVTPVLQLQAVDVAGKDALDDKSFLVAMSTAAHVNAANTEFGKSWKAHDGDMDKMVLGHISACKLLVSISEVNDLSKDVVLEFLNTNIGNFNEEEIDLESVLALITSLQTLFMLSSYISHGFIRGPGKCIVKEYHQKLNTQVSAVDSTAVTLMKAMNEIAENAPEIVCTDAAEQWLAHATKCLKELQLEFGPRALKAMKSELRDQLAKQSEYLGSLTPKWSFFIDEKNYDAGLAKTHLLGSAARPVLTGFAGALLKFQESLSTTVPKLESGGNSIDKDAVLGKEYEMSKKIYAGAKECITIIGACSIVEEMAGHPDRQAQALAMLTRAGLPKSLHSRLQKIAS